jgi:ribosome biogenesis GTPase
MTLADLGYHDDMEQFRKELRPDGYIMGRIVAEHRERYMVQTEDGELEAEVLGQLRFSTRDRLEFPAVGDWVAVSVYNESDAIIHAIYPRRNTLQRQAVGKFGEKQVVAANIDGALIVQGVDRDFNLNRLERYLAISRDSHIEPVIVLSKIDQVDRQELASRFNMISKRISGIRVIAISNITGEGLEELFQLIEKGKTFCLLGSSGVGKSTLINRLAGRELMNTGAVSEHTKKGRHVTSRREMVILEKGGILIDNPGMREIGLTDNGDGLVTVFDQIEELSRECRYSDCRHQHENGCAVTAALENGDLDRDAYENYLKMQREKMHFQSSIAEKRRRDKQFGKIYKAFKKNRDQYDI